jgi:bifunctional DNA-binding transcriptional regulator/antitoxin component of YhaV-PrlF toxin-antitoxin module
MTSVIRDSNLLEIPEALAEELGLQAGSPVEVTRTENGFEVRPAPRGMRRGADGVWRTHEERMAILDRFEGQGQRLGLKGGVEDFIRMRMEEDVLELEDELA